MKRNKGIVRWTLIGAAIFAPLLGAAYIHHQRDNFSCEIHSAIVDENRMLDVILDFSFNNGNGFYESAGELIENGGSPQSVSNKIAFRYWREDGSVILVSDETNPLPTRYETFRKYIPDFFQQRDRGLRLQITPVNASSYIFTYGGAPVFYCSKS
ncbi:hypothetical protein ABR157_001927 [Enterobacter soli]|uniref:hypothetical protein n=1 Tax=Enterobacter soli TaxID=885040 RepID=UPI00289E6ED9|nr:hypothetical protein [Enterobacter soli]